MLGEERQEELFMEERQCVLLLTMLLKGRRCSHFTDEEAENPRGDITGPMVPQIFSGKGRTQTHCIRYLSLSSKLPPMQQLKTARV